ncbi:MAG: hypothetical protein GWN67_14120 [Phycisphaerae bacterium]|nr:hypothetical protein [Phycisphaerae bacterium]NIP55056.1 hypothetical protein [Phycisphaerae bacterium]NIS53766.1 hypothetical protein [Phycisphaerae bacterium]NIU11344.1 hypothetical protein [Phycisphaerae bacterium]NIU57474.1 hypothetical protein [Phycisphaerae bacterium]
MTTRNPNVFSTKLRQRLNSQLCPECGSRMTEVDQSRENGVLFVWYNCSRKDCDGQWLRKTSPVILYNI